MKKNREIDLINGPITRPLIKLALPIMATSFVQMAYNLTDMLFIGREGSDAVAAVGTAGFFPWFAVSLILLSKAGAQIRIAQSVGMQNEAEEKKYIKTGIQLNIILSIIYIVIIWLFHDVMISFFRLGNDNVIYLTKQYLLIVSFGLVFYSLNPLFTSIFTALGDSHTPFVINSIALVINIILDMTLIFGLGPFPELKVAGAAIATVIAQAAGTLIFIGVIIKRHDKRFKQNYLSKIDWPCAINMAKLGLPIALQEGLFSVFAMIIARLIAPFGAVAIAVQKVGSQIESISWMTAEGFSAALSTYVGQNYGAQKYERIFKGYKVTMILSCIIGAFATALLIGARVPLFRLFINDAEAIRLGADYLFILGLSQLFMCMEITTTGAFNGFGETRLPSTIGIVLTGARIPATMVLSKVPALGLNGVWWSISLSSVLKGLILVAIFAYYMKNKKYLARN